jgi:hypothetical protein
MGTTLTRRQDSCVSDPNSIRSVDPDPDPEAQKLPTKIEKSKEIHVLKCWMFVEGFSSILDFLNGGLRISK